MEVEKEFTCVILPSSDWQMMKKMLEEIAVKLNTAPVQVDSRSPLSPYITAKEFMASVRICRSNFDKLVQQGKIRTLKKGRKVYVPTSEVERYFMEVQV